ncbi:Serine/threonine-protein phosphatase 2A activator [Irineochytrium annulatum]|nr:Serine/threonine-protein phosphatase 2A activator [Irineochytrium annulatum]
MPAWLRCEGLARYLDFLHRLNAAVKNKSNADACLVSEPCEQLLSILDTLTGWIEQFPPLETPQRFGNKAFRQWADNMEERLLVGDTVAAFPELREYFILSFGHSVRLDYGSGHEMCFALWLCCLHQLGILKPEDYQAVVTRVFVKYKRFER